MAIRYYDDLLVEKLKRWIPEAANLRVLHPDEVRKLFELNAEDHNDQALRLPLIALSRKDDIELLSTTKSPKSYDGLTLLPDSLKAELEALESEQAKDLAIRFPKGVYQLNVLPIHVEYQLDIYTKRAEECEEYVREFLFKLINNPVIKIEIPYRDTKIEHIANIRIMPNIANTSSIGERLFSGQFTRWTIQFELQDAFLFSVPYRKNWRLVEDDEDATAVLEVSPAINVKGAIEHIHVEPRSIDK